MQVVLGPHVYGPSVTGASSGYSGTDLTDRLTKSFGSKTVTGYQGHRFAVIIGEFGSFFDSRTPKDFDMYRTLVAYMRNADSSHNAVASWVFWDWNPNSGDTGGIVHDDWLTVNWGKIDLLAGTDNASYTDGLNLKPWFFGP